MKLYDSTKLFRMFLRRILCVYMFVQVRMTQGAPSDRAMYTGNCQLKRTVGAGGGPDHRISFPNDALFSRYGWGIRSRNWKHSQFSWCSSGRALVKR